MKKIEMRELTAEDIGMMFDIASAVGSDEIAALTEDPAIAAAVSRLGSGSFREVGAVAAAKAVAIIIRNYRKCEPLLRQLLASVTGKSEAEIAKSGAETVAVVTHGGVIRSLVTHYLHMDGAYVPLLAKHLENCGITEFYYRESDGEMLLNRFNDFAHLMDEPELLRGGWGEKK